MRSILTSILVTLAITGTFLSNANAQSFLDKLKDNLLKGGEQGQSSTQSSTPASGLLSNEQLIAGLREALKVGTTRVVERVGARDGFNNDPAIHIPLPPALQQVQSTLRQVGLSGLADDLELKLNRAAEQAAPKTKDLIWTAIQDMTLDDAQRIYNGPDDAATQYFRRVAGNDLAGIVKPVIDTALQEAGAVQAWDALLGQYDDIPFMPDIKANLSDHAVNLTMEGVYHYLAIEEAAIRENPAKRSTELLQQVFGL